MEQPSSDSNSKILIHHYSKNRVEIQPDETPTEAPVKERKKSKKLYKEYNNERKY